MKRLLKYIPDVFAVGGIGLLVSGFLQLNSAWGMVAAGTVLIIVGVVLAVAGVMVNDRR